MLFQPALILIRIESQSTGKCTCIGDSIHSCTLLLGTEMNMLMLLSGTVSTMLMLEC